MSTLITKTLKFEIQRRDINEFNMAQIWMECNVKLEYHKHKWSEVVQMYIVTTDVTYEVTIHLSIFQVGEHDWKAFYQQKIL